MIRLYDTELSGNCYKVRLFLSFLGHEYARIPIDLAAGQNRTPEFLRLNPLAEVPVLEDGALVLRDSQAILVYLARKYAAHAWLPTDPQMKPEWFNGCRHPHRPSGGTAACACDHQFL